MAIIKRSLVMAFVLALVLTGCVHLNSVKTPAAYSLDDVFIDPSFARMEVLPGYRGYAGKVIKVEPFNRVNWLDNSTAIYWNWDKGKEGYYQITVSMSVMAESASTNKAVISAYRPPQRTSRSPTELKWNGPANIGWTVQNGEKWDQFGGKAVEIPVGKWVDLTFTQAVETASTDSGQVYLDGHSDHQGLLDLTLYVRNFRVTMKSTNNFIAMTFDNAPSDFTDVLLDKLYELNVKSTFFLLRAGIEAEHPIHDKLLPAAERKAKTVERKAVVKRIFEEGHSIGILADIPNPPTEAAIRKELEDSRLAIQKAVYGDDNYSKQQWVPRYIRIPPETDPAAVTILKKVAAEMEMPIILGSGYGDNKRDSPEENAELLYSKCKTWEVIINKDLRSDGSILKVLDILIPKLTAESYVSVTLSKMAELRKKPLIPGNVYDNLDPAAP